MNKNRIKTIAQKVRESMNGRTISSLEDYRAKAEVNARSVCRGVFEEEDRDSYEKLVSAVVKEVML
jgi:hypothetical protein